MEEISCYLLGLTSSAELERSPFLGPLFEGFVAAESSGKDGWLSQKLWDRIK